MPQTGRCALCNGTAFGLFALPPNMTQDLDAYNRSKACIFDFLTEGHYGLFSDLAIQEVVRRWGQEVAAELKIRSYGSVALYFANCDAPDTNVYFHADVATPQDEFEGGLVFLLCVIVAAAIIIPLRMAVRRWIRDRIARAFAARRQAQHPPHPPYQQLYQYPYAQHYSPLPTSASPGSVPHAAAAGGPAAGPAAGGAAGARVAMGYPVISPPPQHQPAAAPAEGVADQAKLETDPLLLKQHKATAGDANV